MGRGGFDGTMGVSFNMKSIHIEELRYKEGRFTGTPRSAAGRLGSDALLAMGKRLAFL